MNSAFPFRPFALAAIAALAVSVAAQTPVHPFLNDRLKAPTDPLAYYGRVQEGARLYGERKYAEAAKVFEAAVAEYPEDGTVWIYLANNQLSSGRPKDAIASYQRGLALTSAWQPHRVYYYLAQAYMAAGDKEGAYRTLETLLADGEWTSKPSLIDVPAFAPLRKEPRFLKLVGRWDTSKLSRDAGWRTDIDYLASEVKRVNAVYRTQPLPPDFVRLQKALKRDVPKLTDDEIFVRMGGILATLHQGHNGFWEGGKIRFHSAPLHLYAFPEGIFIIDAHPEYRELIGSEVVKIENVPIDEVLRRVEENEAVESRMEILWGGMQQLTIIEILRGLGVVPKGRAEIRMTLKAADGKTTERTFPVKPHEERRKLKPAPNVPPPLFLRDVPRQHWFEAIPGADTLFVQVNQISPSPNETVPQFGLRLRKHLTDNPTKNVIVDVRHNNGGDTSTYPELLRTLIGHTTKEDNRLYVIIGRGSYSATANFITDLERLANPIFVGEPSSATGNQHGDESSTIFPYSGAAAWLTSVRWQLSHPWDRRRSIVPDIPVQLTAKAYFAGGDPAVETILAHIRSGRP
ncbi:MAG: tetratricopeptide repeat protein [Fimbriimonas sp.]